jgi:hypothetical protein
MQIDHRPGPLKTAFLEGLRTRAKYGTSMVCAVHAPRRHMVLSPNPHIEQPGSPPMELASVRTPTRSNDQHPQDFLLCLVAGLQQPLCARHVIFAVDGCADISGPC